ncbi:MAG TPA: acetyl-CoA hydrolase/transferase C-terminal domain-containing protein [Ignavibacteria bacterium]|nr:acetyl-CoA hydrolase/transferase C-terminal domain-containing protein [Ignavibacteria bacterium]
MYINKPYPKSLSAKEAVKKIKSGDNVWIHSNCAFPTLLVEAMCDYAKESPDAIQRVNIYQLFTFQKARYADKGMEKNFTVKSLFTGASVREAVNSCRADFIPIFLSEIPRLLESREIPLDVALIQLSPPDKHGFCSFGVSNECSKIAAENARMIIAHINPEMPRVLGDNFIHISRIQYIVEESYPVSTLPMVADGLPEESKKVFEKIGKNIASLINDGDTLQMGIGAIPDAVLPHLKAKNDLGIHTEMFSDGLIELMKLGVVNGLKKTLLEEKVVASFVIGTKNLFDFIDDNPLIEFRTSRFTNDPFVISRNENMISINSAIEIDITGQVCADSIGNRLYSGFGGQVDFIRGASRSKNGKPIIAIPSTAKDGTISKIMPMLSAGAGVTTSRGDVHYVITENGIANLFGKSLRERVESLISIAHPKFHEELYEKAKELKYFW